MIVYHPAFLEHLTGRGHPESPRRLEAIMERLARSPALSRFVTVRPPEAPREDILRIHDDAYLTALEAQCSEGHLFHADPDTIGSPATFRAACLAAGAAVAAADAIRTGQARRVFCAVRPPGHHAGRTRAQGFCFLNNAAIAARHLQAVTPCRVAILDWDAHHGNGTQDAFYDDPSVLYVSLHQYPLYPSSGRADETGTGAGKGFTLNIPLARGSGDADCLRAFREQVEPAIDRFKPDCLIVSAGFDGHKRDPLAGLELTASGFAGLTASAVRMANTHAAGRIVSVLEGGYDLEALADSTEAHLEALFTD